MAVMSPEDEKLLFANWTRTGGTGTMDIWRGIGRPLFFKPPEEPPPTPPPYVADPLPIVPPPVMWEPPPTLEIGPPKPLPEPYPIGIGKVPPPTGTFTLQDYGQWLAARTSDQINAIFPGGGPTYNEWVSYMSGEPITPGVPPVVPPPIGGGGIMPQYTPPEETPFVPPEMPNPWEVGSPQYMEQLYGRGAGYGTALGLYGRQYWSPYEQYLGRQQQPLGTLYDIAGRLATGGQMGQYAPGGMYSEWAPGYAENPFAMYGLARGMMGSVFGMTPEQRATAGIQYGGGDLSALLGMGLRTQLGKQTAGWLTGQLPVAQEQWQQQYPDWQAGAGQPSFLDYVKQKYNLGQYF